MRFRNIMLLNFSASSRIQSVLENLGRTEDIRFSPSCKRLAIAGYDKNVIVLVDLQVTTRRQHKKICIHNAIEVSFPCFKSPHRIDFFDDETLGVANRDGGVSIVRVPSSESKNKFEVLKTLCSKELLSTPGSVAV